MTRPPDKIMAAKRWSDQAEANVDRWGDQAPATLVLAMVEELGEIAAELESVSGPGDGVPPLGDYDKSPHKGRELVAAMAELGERTRDYLEENFEDVDGTPKSKSDRKALRTEILGAIDDPDAVQDEVDDLAPLLFQLTWALDDVDDSDSEGR